MSAWNTLKFHNKRTAYISYWSKQFMRQNEMGGVKAHLKLIIIWNETTKSSKRWLSTYMKFSNSNMYKISIFFAIHNTSSCLKLTIIIYIIKYHSCRKVSMKTFNDSKWNSCKIEVLISSETALSLATATALSISLSLSHSCFLFVNTLYFVINEWLTFSHFLFFIMVYCI